LGLPGRGQHTLKKPVQNAHFDPRIDAGPKDARNRDEHTPFGDRPTGCPADDLPMKT
jgi:hypothetical protein